MQTIVTEAPSTQQTTSQRIAALNDQLRQLSQPTGHNKKVLTAGVNAMPMPDVLAILQNVATFNQFNDDNDPYGEHDFGRFTYKGQRFFWKIDYFDLTLTEHSPDSTNPNVTARVLTIMLASEY
jgi:hypothetical protein